mgnify:CR=1 FL=1
MYRFLDNIKSPEDLKKLNIDELNILCSEIRDCIINTVAENGGHLAPNLGTVELTVALHKVFDCPNDAIVFDVGHQSYTHKLLTGRYERFNTLRKKDGISGFSRPEESECDPFVSGHSSTSISSARGVSHANDLLGISGSAVAVIGDGALTGGMAYEAMINTSKKDKSFIVVLNDNKMSISKNRGALSKHLSKIRTRKNYFKFKSGVERFLVKIPLIGHSLRSFVFKVKAMVKSAIYDSNIFESFGFYYMGPADGHDIATLIDLLTIAKDEKRPVLLHIKTVKGKGYAPAEANPDVYHGVSSFDRSKGVQPSGKETFSSVFGDELCRLAEDDEKICAITAAMPGGTGLEKFAARFKNRFFDVGIAEQHAVTFSSALAKKGLKPVFAVYSTFLQRSYDQIIHDAAIAELPLTLAVDRAGLVGEDGETHQGLFDVSFLTSIPKVTVYAPSCYNELRLMLRNRLKAPIGVAAIRYPRGSEGEIPTGYSFSGNPYDIIGNGKTAVITYGTLFNSVFYAMRDLADEGIDISVVKLNTISELPDELIESLASAENIVFFEEGIEAGGIAEKLGCKLMLSGYRGSYTVKAINGFVKQDTVLEQRKKFGLDPESIIKTIREVV